MSDPWQKTLRQLHASRHRVALVAAGGGGRQVGDCFAIGGASQTFIEAAIPYSRDAMRAYLGGMKLESHASPAAARALAVRAFEYARRHEAPENCTGIAVVAALPTTRPRRGSDRIDVVLHNHELSAQWSLAFDHRPTTRPEAERVADRLLRRAITWLVDRDVSSPEFDFESCGILSHDFALASQRNSPQTHATNLIFPGSFNPVHDGHRNMARVARERFATPVTVELSTVNVDKPALDHLTIRERLRGASELGDVRLTSASRFIEKAELFPGARFIIGADTAVRLDDVKYDGDDPGRHRRALDTIAMQGCRFVVFGRLWNGRFHDAETLELSSRLAALCEFIPETEFRTDTSSTAIRSLQVP